MAAASWTVKSAAVTPAGSSVSFNAKSQPLSTPTLVVSNRVVPHKCVQVRALVGVQAASSAAASWVIRF